MSINSSNAPLALRYEAPAAYGTNEEINSIVERMAVLMPTRLADWQLKPGYIEKAEKNLNNAFYKTAQLAIFYRLIPSQDIHIIPFGNDFVVDMGIEAWRKSADRYCAMHQVTYHVHTEEMTTDELKKRRGNKYDAEDVGVVAYLWRSDKENVYKIFGAKESMSRACGVWAKKAKDVNGRWQEDTIPAQRTKEDVAKRRAIKAVLKLEFSLDSLLAATPAEVRESARNLESNIRYEEMRQAVPASRRVELDDDGFIIVEQPSRRSTIDDVQFVVAEENAPRGFPSEGPDVDDLLDAAQEGTEEAQDEYNASADYSILVQRLTGTAASFAAWTRKTHLNSNGPATPDQYRYLVGVLNGITGDKGSYRALLGVMLTRHVDSGNRPGINLTSKLLEWLVAEHVDEVTGEKVANLAYRKDYAETVKAMWQTISEAA